jgi:hypothetical protein
VWHIVTPSLVLVSIISFLNLVLVSSYVCNDFSTPRSTSLVHSQNSRWYFNLILEMMKLRHNKFKQYSQDNIMSQDSKPGKPAPDCNKNRALTSSLFPHPSPCLCSTWLYSFSLHLIDELLDHLCIIKKLKS